MMTTRYFLTIVLTSLFISTSTWGGVVDPSRYFNKSYAVVIGIRNYQNSARWDELVNNENDANAIGDFLSGQGFQVKRFIGNQATKANIVACLEDDLARTFKQTDNIRIVFYFSGHGGTEEYGGEQFGYIIPYDGTDRPSTWIAMEKIHELSAKLGNARHQLFILDSCFGGLINPKSSSISSSDDPVYLKELASRRVRLYLTAGGADEKVPGRSALPGYEQYSHYTAYLLRGLRDGFADQQRDGIITTSELEAYLVSAARRETRNKFTPSWGTFDAHEGGDFVFRSPKPAKIEQNFEPIAQDSWKSYDKEAYDWKILSGKGKSGLESYIALYPEGVHLNEARRRLATLPPPTKPVQVVGGTETIPSQSSRLTAQQQAQAIYNWETDIIYAKNSGAIEDFLRRFPGSTYEQEARRKLAELKAQGR